MWIKLYDGCSEVKTIEALDIIFENAKVDVESFKEPFGVVRKILRYYRKDIPLRPRYLYDADAVYFYNFDNAIRGIVNEKKRRDLAERGDIMTSLWAPLTYYLGLNGGRIIGKNNANIDMILAGQRSDGIFKLLEYLSMKYASRGNLLLLPNAKNHLGIRRLNSDKFILSEDKIDQFLFWCMGEGLIEYFDNELENVIDWILSEHLECLFSEKFFNHSLVEIEEGKVIIQIKREDIKKDNIQSLICDNSKIETYKYRDFQDKDWQVYFDRLNKVIAYRNAVDFESHLPFEWI